MAFIFKTILIPADFSINTEIAVKKAVELCAGEEEVSLHLFHCYTSSFYHEKVVLEANNKLLQWKQTIEESLPAARVQIKIMHAVSVQEAIAGEAMTIKADLIIVGKTSHHSWFPFLNTIVPSELADSTGSAVLTAKQGALYHTMKTILVPITDYVPEHKLEVIAELSKRFRLKIHLITFMNEKAKPEQFSAPALLKVYRWLKQYVHSPLEYAVLHGDNKAKTMVSYAEKIDADVLLVDPQSETKLGWMNRHISDVLPGHSKLEVLSVLPAHRKTT